ncbi:transporter, partial [Vibrio hepatarius]
MVPAIAAGNTGHYSHRTWGVVLTSNSPKPVPRAQLGKRSPSAVGTAYFVRWWFNKVFERGVAWFFVSVIPVGVPAAIALAAGFLQQLLPDAVNSAIVAHVIT